MQVFVFEYVAGGGLWDSSSQPFIGSLLAEGAAMLQSIVADFASLADVNVVTTCDSRLPLFQYPGVQVVPIGSAEEELDWFMRLAADADWTLLIVPESGGVLLDRCRRVEALGSRLLSPSSECVAIAASKQATGQRLAHCGIRVPCSALLAPGAVDLPADFRFPAVSKPIDGCGSVGVRLVPARSEFRSDGDAAIRLEEFIPGLAASVAVLCGPAGNHALPACEQRLSQDGRFKYLGGRLPLEPRLDARARGLALAAARALPAPRGYIGIDLVVGDADDGSGDRVIEINPRLTTSYIGLRARSKTSLAAAMLAVANGQTPDLCFGDEPVEFTADGTVC